MAIKQISLTLLSLVFVFTRGLAKETITTYNSTGGKVHKVNNSCGHDEMFAKIYSAMESKLGPDLSIAIHKIIETSDDKCSLFFTATNCKDPEKAKLIFAQRKKELAEQGIL